MAKLSLKQRELKRETLVAKYAKKYAELQAVANEGHAEVAQIFLVHDLEQVARDLVLHKLLRVQGKPQTGKPLADRRRAPV